MPKIINVKVNPRASENKVTKEGSYYKVKLTAPPVDNKANFALIGLLADYFGVKKSQISIIKGVRSRDKKVVIE